MHLTPMGQSLLLLTPGTRLKKSISHLSVALPGNFLSDGPFAQPIEMRVPHGTRPLFAAVSLTGKFMSATSISFGLLIVLFTILLLHRLSKLKPQIAGNGSQRMCPSCRLITSRLKTCCLECGESLTAVRVTPNSREIARRLSPRSARLWSSEIRSMKNKGEVRC
jgi:hypothetical protein